MSSTPFNDRPIGSWVASANDPDCGFPIQSLPFCVFEHDGYCRIGIGIGDKVLDLTSCAEHNALGPLPPEISIACSADALNGLMTLNSGSTDLLRDRLTSALRADAAPDMIRALEPLLHTMRAISFFKPVEIGDYTDFYASLNHATNVGRLFRPDQPLLPNYKFVPIGYHGRASSVVISGTPVHRPHGQIKSPDAASPVFAPTRQLDYEAELGAFIQKGNRLGEPIGIAKANTHIFGFSLVNDWSARDIQAWEYQPLGPFLGKNFVTSVSPWVIPSAALAPFRVRLRSRSSGDPAPLPYLHSPQPECDGLAVELQVHISSQAMRDHSLAPVQLSNGNTQDLYWSFGQMIAHHTSNGCNLRAGDLIASGTVSGTDDESLGCLLEITRRGAQPFTLPTGEIRSFLEDGDEVILSGRCHREGLPFITLGECRGTIIAAAQT